VSGRRRKPEVGALERRCHEKGFSLERSGQFSIGVLSYFMLADHVALRTLHNEGEGAEAVGWRFETDGIGSFGELRPDAEAKRGTEVTLRLRRELYAATGRQERDPTSWYRSQVFQYLHRILLRVPCEFEFERERYGEQFHSPGWVESVKSICTGLLNRTSLEGYLPDSRDRLKQEIWEGDLPEEAGTYRLLFPYFDLPEGGVTGLFR